MKERTPQKDGWLVITRAEYDKLCEHDYAGTDPDGTVWALAMDSTGATCLWKGLQLIDKRLSESWS